MLKNRIQAFSLAEVIVALIISTLGLTLINIGVYGIHHQLTSNAGTKERIQWEKVISTLESEQMKFKWNGTSKEGKPILYCQTQKCNYLLGQNHHNLILQGENGQGFMPIFMNVQTVRFFYDEPFLKIQLKVNGHNYSQKIVMQRKKNEID